ncbi:MAG: sulfatase-like hydrolase/transferase [Thermoanaerobaculia bacterium]
MRASRPLAAPGLALATAAWCVLLSPTAVEARRPNVLIIITDDQGYADAGFQGSERIPTPHIDALARAGVRFGSGYVSHPFCSPSRAGLLTGRYPQRFGHENNPAYLPADESVGLPVSELTLADVLQEAGYVTGLVGKWHLGAAPPFYPRRRGFDEFFGFLGGGHDYFEAAPPGGRRSGGRRSGDPPEEYTVALERNGRPVELDAYLTDVLTDEATAFVRRHHQRPFLLLLSYNAPHTPYQAPPRYRDRFADIPDGDCRTYAAMIAAVDAGVGRVLAALREFDLDRRTLIFFLSDNGGQLRYRCADNAPLRGGKGTVFEGGIRVPFLATWPGRLPAGVTYQQPVTALDIFPTAAAAAGVDRSGRPALDGVDLLPYLTGDRESAPHASLYWRFGNGAGWAVRQGRWKLVKQRRRRALFDLQSDIGERRNLAARHPALVRELTAAYRSWSEEMVGPRWPNPGREKAAPSDEKAKAVYGRDSVARALYAFAGI